MKFNDLKISTRLTLGFGLMALLIGLMGTLSVVLARSADKAFHSIIDDRFPKVLHLHVAKEDVTGVELALTQMLLDTSTENVQRHQATINAKRQQITQLFETLAQQITTPKARQRWPRHCAHAASTPLSYCATPNWWPPAGWTKHGRS